jgi:hypothetical protein
MAKKRTPAASAAPVEVIKDRSGDSVVLTVETSDRLTLLLFASEVRAARAEAVSAAMSAEAMLKAVDPEGKVQKALQAAAARSQAVQVADMKYASAVAAVEKKLGVSLEGMAMDPETGVVKPIEKPVDGDQTK